MPRIMVLGAVAVFFFAPAGRAQDEADLLKKESGLLKKENELLKKEVELLKKEIEQLKMEAKAKPGAGKRAENGAKPETKDTGKDDDTEYELIKCVRIASTKRVTFTFSAVNKVKDVVLGGATSGNPGGAFGGGFARHWKMSLTARDGQPLEARAVFDSRQPAVKLTKGIGEKFQITVDGVDQDISRLDTISLSYHNGLMSESEPVKFRNIKIEKAESSPKKPGRK